ncbi:hypothetical protein CANTEDRAFT_99081 [Yamadazyma tenuis ATCC 10573]|uniref:CTLH/CRA C-terminal to LisH motif domain-containing protein n=2 Tax=Candida tenuis TaxID=2315449 RepID=G3B9V4_CANTC|nr:uncharacterized protein CANTEDRAFT_99081 [Yamadazyma tenuis ATCC 10573]EGV61975.1 hypothetical protein CANTEDRAFT_99081 [Yamadazyma tenuis ATCC 10573]
MSTTLLDNLATESTSFSEAGEKYLSKILDDTHSFVGELKSMEQDLVQQLEQESQGAHPDPVSLESLKNSDLWYKQSIDSLKGYNGQINKFTKHILHNSKYNINLDGAYTYPLNLDNIPVEYLKGPTPGASHDDLTLRDVKMENQKELMKAIVLHLLKIGQSDLIKDMLNDTTKDIRIDEDLLDKFQLLNQIVDGIVLNHDLSKALSWFKQKHESAGPHSNFQEIEFKFHILEYTLLLNRKPNSSTDGGLDSALEAYMYSKQNFPRFFDAYLPEISPLMSLLLFKAQDDVDSSHPDDYARKHMMSLLSDFMIKMKSSFNKDLEQRPSKRNESRFVEEILKHFSSIEQNQNLFQSLSNEFISYYCKDLNLSNDSSLFQSVLSGFINLPSFYKYNQIQRRFSKVRSSSMKEDFDIDTINAIGTSEVLDDPKDKPRPPSIQSKHFNIISPYSFDMPFQLSDSNRFLFDYHPIFICPVTKEQLIPLTVDEVEIELEKKAKRPKLEVSKNDELLKSMHNPVVVLKHCQHVALKESIWQLSKRGSEIFRCHYCYKKHRFSEVTEAYFIDL